MLALAEKRRILQLLLNHAPRDPRCLNWSYVNRITSRAIAKNETDLRFSL